MSSIRAFLSPRGLAAVTVHSDGPQLSLEGNTDKNFLPGLKVQVQSGRSYVELGSYDLPVGADRRWFLSFSVHAIVRDMDHIQRLTCGKIEDGDCKASVLREPSGRGGTEEVHVRVYGPDLFELHDMVLDILACDDKLDWTGHYSGPVPRALQEEPMSGSNEELFRELYEAVEGMPWDPATEDRDSVLALVSELGRRLIGEEVTIDPTPLSDEVKRALDSAPRSS